MGILLQMHYFKGEMDVTGNIDRSKNENLKYGLKQKRTLDEELERVKMDIFWR